MKYTFTLPPHIQGRRSSLQRVCVYIKHKQVDILQNQYRQTYHPVDCGNLSVLELLPIYLDRNLVRWGLSQRSNGEIDLIIFSHFLCQTIPLKSIVLVQYSNYWIIYHVIQYIYTLYSLLPLVSNHGKLGPCPRPWRGGGTAHRTTAICRLRARCEGLRACHRKGEGGYGTGP